MSLRVVIELAGPPRGKGRARATVTKRGFAHVYTDDKTRKYEAQLRFAAQQQMAGREPTILPVRVQVEVYLEIMPSWPRWQREAAEAGEWLPIGRGSGDADNFLKVLDALNGIVWQDDAQIVEAHVFKRCGTPRLVIAVETIDPPAKPEKPARLRQTGSVPVADLFGGVLRPAVVGL